MPILPASEPASSSSRRRPSSVLRAFRDEPIAARLHTAIRWWSCPFPAIVEVVPNSSRVLDFGCGHGLLALQLITDDPTRTVVATDVDDSKLATLRRASAATGAGAVHVERSVGSVPAGPWDAIVLADVLYLLPYDQQHELLADLATALGPGGTLIIKDLHDRWPLRMRVSQLQERLATRVLRLTQGHSVAFAGPSRLRGWLEEAGLVVEIDRPLPGVVHPHHLLVARRPH